METDAGRAASQYREFREYELTHSKARVAADEIF